MNDDGLKWLGDILDRIKRRLIAHRETLSHSESPEIRGVLADVDAASLITKELKNEHTNGTGNINADL